MRQLIAFTFIVFFSFLADVRGAEILDRDIPPRQAFVNDYADLLSERQKERLDALLADFERQTSFDVVVATFPTFGDRPLESFMLELASRWKLGYKDVGNGVVFAVFKKEAEAAVETGPSLADKFPFSFRKKLIQSAAPHFRRENYDDGTEEAIRKLIRKLDPSYSIKDGLPASLTGLETHAAWIGLALLVTLLLDIRSFMNFQKSMSQTRGSAYRRERGRYSFAEWWVLYGILPSAAEFVYFHLLRRWLNPGFLIGSEGVKPAVFHLRNNRGRFFGNGAFGSW